MCDLASLAVFNMHSLFYRLNVLFCLLNFSFTFYICLFVFLFRSLFSFISLKIILKSCLCRVSSNSLSLYSVTEELVVIGGDFCVFLYYCFGFHTSEVIVLPGCFGCCCFVLFCCYPVYSFS